MWNFLINLTNHLFGLVTLPFVFIFWLISLPFLACGFCVHDKNKHSFFSSDIDNISMKLSEFQDTHGKKLNIDESKLTHLTVLMQKMHEGSDNISKSEIKKMEKEIKHEMRHLKQDIKSQMSKREYIATKKELKQEFKSLVEAKSQLSLFKEDDLKLEQKATLGLSQTLSALRI